MKKLNKKQKQFLFDNYYVTAKVLDACVEEGWQNYFIKWFTWELSLNEDMYGFNRLYLRDKDNGDIEYTIGLNFQNNDLQTLLNTL